MVDVEVLGVEKELVVAVIVLVVVVVYVFIAWMDTSKLARNKTTWSML